MYPECHVGLQNLQNVPCIDPDNGPEATYFYSAEEGFVPGAHSCAQRTAWVKVTCQCPASEGAEEPCEDDIL